MEFLVIASDNAAAGALRQKVRPYHIAAANQTVADGNMLIGGAILDADGAMVGSMTVVSFPTRLAFDAWLRSAPYMRAGVWDKVTVHPYQTAVIAPARA